MDSLRVILVDDSSLFRNGLAALLAPAGVEVVGLAATCEEAMTQIADCRPDVVVMDIRMPPSFTDEGLRAAHEIKTRFPEAGVLLLSGILEPSSAAGLFDEHNRGIGYLLKDRVDNAEALIRDLHRVARGELVLDPDVVQALFRRRRNAQVLEKLSDRERAVLQLMAEGRSNAGIAAELNVSLKTVESYGTALFAKLDLAQSPDSNTRVMAVLAWMRTRAQ